MSYYSELKPYEEHLERWKRAKAWGRHHTEEQKQVITIYERNTGQTVNRSCNTCLGSALDRISNYFFTEKEKYSQRRKGKTKQKTGQ